MIWSLFAAGLVAAGASLVRWLRVAQREHYLAPAATRFALRWWGNGWVNRLLALGSVIGVVGSLFNPWLAWLTVAAQVGPVGLSLRGRTSPLAWTARLRRVAILAGLLIVVLMASGLLLEAEWQIALTVVMVPLLVDVALALLAPVESTIGDRWVAKAADRLDRSGVRVVAITGSYGKTTTKQYLAHLISPHVRTVASPASFNNRMGLARAVNEGLVPGTEVFIAEMGTYGKGEIADLCSWVKPEVAAIVSIGPVHLERFRTEDAIVEAKSEILDGARVGVIAVDHPLLAELVERRTGAREIITVSGAGIDATVSYHPETGTLRANAVDVGVVPGDVFPTNLAVAVGIASALGIAVDGSLFESLPRAEHRQTELVGAGGFKIIDDTFNSNPAGAARALQLLAQAAPEGKRVVVTPGMVELGPLQDRANEDFAREAAQIADHLLLVGSTNQPALLRGSDKGGASVSVVANRDEAVEWVRAHLTAGDAVLYENDLPDHYP
jgi:UDP-N-acetylmuramoyl-tripeptide--D-alanyl-D-alanine ligase